MIVLKRVAITVEETVASRMILVMRHTQEWNVHILWRDIFKISHGCMQIYRLHQPFYFIILCLLWDLLDLAGDVYLHSNTTRTPHHVCFEFTGASWCCAPTQQHYPFLLLYLFLNYSPLNLVWALLELAGAVCPHSNTTRSSYCTCSWIIHH
jgi:hypothetical protein